MNAAAATATIASAPSLRMIAPFGRGFPRRSALWVWSTEARSRQRRPKCGLPQSSLRASPRIRALLTEAAHNALARLLCDHWYVRPTVLIVDDHDGFRESVRALLEAEG